MFFEVSQEFIHLTTDWKYSENLRHFLYICFPRECQNIFCYGSVFRITTIVKSIQFRFLLCRLGRLSFRSIKTVITVMNSILLREAEMVQVPQLMLAVRSLVRVIAVVHVT